MAVAWQETDGLREARKLLENARLLVGFGSEPGTTELLAAASQAAAHEVTLRAQASALVDIAESLRTIAQQGPGVPRG